jgi:chemotaxis signal transduction protein
MVSKTVAAEAGTQAPADPQWVVFRCHGRQFGFPLALVREILTPQPVTRLPGAAAEICGLTGVRGRVITVVDVGLMLGGRAAASLPDHRLLLLDLGTRRVGAAVDDVVTVTPARLETGSGPVAGEPYAGVPAAALLGSGAIETGRFVALEPAALMAPLLG